MCVNEVIVAGGYLVAALNGETTIWKREEVCTCKTRRGGEVRGERRRKGRRQGGKGTSVSGVWMGCIERWLLSMKGKNRMVIEKVQQGFALYRYANTSK
jgi:hypothetical protein